MQFTFCGVPDDDFMCVFRLGEINIVPSVGQCGAGCLGDRCQCFLLMITDEVLHSQIRCAVGGRNQSAVAQG